MRKDSTQMPGNKYTSRNSTKVERLLRERELRKFNRSFIVNEDTGESINTTGERKRENDSRLSVSRLLSDGHQVENIENHSKQKLLVVANRLPITASRIGEDSWSLEVSAGGLVSALLGVNEVDAKWIGWAGVNVPDEVGKISLTKALAEKSCIPVFLEEDIVDQYYNGYCNNILWPLFHYLGLPQEDRLATTRSFETQFNAYKRANELFADIVCEHFEEGDSVWCHDYHLMFLPKCLKERNRNMKIGWFLHTPFPSSEIHRTLPSRSELLQSVLDADVVGFHTYDYARHFVSACTRILGLEGTPEGVEYQGRVTRVAAFPIGIDANRFKRVLENPDVQENIKIMEERFRGRKVLLGVDRLDMIKGIPQKVLAFEKFLEENPEWQDKVILIQIAVPTRTDVPEYQRLTSQVHEIVGRVNGRFGTLTEAPIHHLDRSIGFDALCALYAVTDVALVTSLRDGMNLVSYEFVACQESKKGVLVLSEFAGAAQSLGAGALLVNPWNISELAASYAQALNMSPDEREKRHRHNYAHVTTHSAKHWAEMFVSELKDTALEDKMRTRQIPPILPAEVAFNRYIPAKNRLLILGFNATLTEPIGPTGRIRGDQIKEMELKLHSELKETLNLLCNDPKTTILILSGSDRSVLDDNFGDYNMWLAAENGMFLRHTKGEWMTTMPEHLNMDWVESVKHVFEYFTERTPRSHFEHRETSLVWNYKYADVEFGRLQARDMLQHLWTGPISNSAVDVVQGSRSVEVRSVGVTKGAGIDRILGEIVHSKCMVTPIDYVLCIGHFLGKDEDIYTFFEPELPAESIAIAKSKAADTYKLSSTDKKTSSARMLGVKNGTKQIQAKAQRVLAEKKLANNLNSLFVSKAPRESVAWHEGSSVLDLNGDCYFSCAVGRKRSNARYLLNSSDDVVTFLKSLAKITAT